MTTDEKLKPLFETQTEHLKIKAFLSEDKLKCFIECEKLPEVDATEEVFTSEIMGLLDKNKIDSDLIHQEVLQDLVQQLALGKEVGRRRIAKGTAASDGRDGKLLLLVKKFTPPKAGATIEYIDPRFIRQFDNIEAGNPIARIYPPKEGADGRDVFGKTIKSKIGKAFKPNLSKNISTEEHDEFQLLLAGESGFLAEEGGKLEIKHELVLKGDIDYHSGDIEFIGAVKISGNVMKDFKVSAREDISITGNVESGLIHSLNGNVEVKGYISGRQLELFSHSEEEKPTRLAVPSQIQVRAAKAVKAGNLQAVSIEAGANVEVQKEISNSLVWSRGIVQVPNGTAFACQIHAVCGLDAKVIGHESGTETVIELVSDIESSPDFSRLISELERHDEAEELLRIYLGVYADKPERVKLLNPTYRKKMEELLRKLERLQSSKKVLIDRRVELMKNAKDNSVYRVNFAEAVYPGVVIRAADEEFRTDKKLTGPATIEYLAEEKKFVVGELKPLTCDIQNSGG